MGSRLIVLAVAGGLLIAGVGWWGLGRGGAEEAPLTARAAGYAVRLALERRGIGEQEAVVEIEDGAGRPVEAEAVTMLAVMAEMGHAAPMFRG